jgi:ABC-type sugar transport system permease subunit
MNKSIRTLLHLLTVLLVVGVAFGLRTHAVQTLPIDYDEDDYLRSGQEFAHLIRTSNWRGFMESSRPGHPPLAKLLIGLSILSTPEKPLVPDVPTSAPPNQNLPRELVQPARGLNAIFGTLTVLALALVNPLAGLFLGIHTFTIKYVSQIMLEAFPALTSFLMVLTYLKWKKGKRPGMDGWLLLSAIFLGLTASSKYLYCVAGIAILVDWYLDAKQEGSLKFEVRNALIWCLLGILVFFATDPFLWPNPLERLKTSVLFHAGYATGSIEVERASYPTWQPFYWLFYSPYWWHEGVFPFPFDLLIGILGLAGLKRLWNKERLYILWVAVAMLFLLIWPTKWPQYVLALTVPLSLAAAEGTKGIWQEILTWWRTPRAKTTYKKTETRRALPWLIPGLLFFIALTLIPILYQFAMSLTTLAGSSLRDGLQGGITREVIGGLTGQIQMPDTPNLDQFKVHYIALSGYLDTLDFLSSFGLTFFGYFWTVVSVSLQAILGISAGLLLARSATRARKIWQTVFILPWAIPEAIGALLWLNIFAPFNGWLALAVKRYGSGIPFGNLMGWERDPDLTLIVLLISALWYGFPFIMLATSAGIKMLPNEVYDAAAIDGASAWQTFRYITWPLLQPLVLPALLVRAIFAFNQFYLFQMFLPYYFQTSNNMITLSSISYYVLFQGSEFAFSATLNIISLILLSIFVLLLNRWSKASEGVTYA